MNTFSKIIVLFLITTIVVIGYTIDRDLGSCYSNLDYGEYLEKKYKTSSFTEDEFQNSKEDYQEYLNKYSKSWIYSQLYFFVW